MTPVAWCTTSLPVVVNGKSLLIAPLMVFARTVAWALGYDEDKGIRWAVHGSYYGTGIALAVYLIVNFLEVGFS